MQKEITEEFLLHKKMSQLRHKDMIKMGYGSLAAISINWKAHSFASLAFAKFAFVAAFTMNCFLLIFVSLILRLIIQKIKIIL